LSDVKSKAPPRTGRAKFERRKAEDREAKGKNLSLKKEQEGWIGMDGWTISEGHCLSTLDRKKNSSKRVYQRAFQPKRNRTGGTKFSTVKPNLQ